MKILYYLFFLIGTRVSAAVVYYDVDNYHGVSDNPFLGSLDIDVVFLEDFESESSSGVVNQLSTPNATGWNGARSGGAGLGVRQDYAPSDSDGGIGYFWTNSILISGATKEPEGIHFDFSRDTHGRLPEYVGAALRGMLGSADQFNNIYVYDSSGIEVTLGEWMIEKTPSGVPPEDQFLNFEGIYVPGGISRILFRDFREVDHLTYGYSAIPEPAVSGLAAAAGLGLGLRRRRLS